ncbi:GNAT family N-acetyltransferase [Streptococcus ovuberis]|uniref:GNAT family N-acetyltransferase n=1 Tax=Streptococcus ovuberis TaxID=1936207 RepID=A0A7X6N1K8_9STRE|nr:GNAT family N-acetyltransferase [Streptococcus ovuberis]NKZ21283.1 GNAT family N-acetyltransferase [Streptococcus ovuberis]
MVKTIVGSAPFQRAASLYIRFQVFVLDKKIAMTDEFDENDEAGTTYAVVYDHNQPLATGRFLPETDTCARLTRIATLASYRGQGYGTLVIKALENHARREGFKELVIHSELMAKSFYEGLGYVAFGPRYLEDGEPCQSLKKQL